MKYAIFINDLFVGLKEYGFINLRDHGIDSNLLKKAYDLSEKLFNLPTATKEQYVFLYRKAYCSFVFNICLFFVTAVRKFL